MQVLNAHAEAPVMGQPKDSALDEEQAELDEEEAELQEV
jgi:hypothetical protein